MKKATQVMKVSFFTNLFLSIFKVVVGFICRSSALLADGVHSFSDLMTDVVALIGSVISTKPADDEHPFGHGRIEYLTSIFIGIIVLAVGLVLINSLANKDTNIPSKLVILVSAFTIITKYLLSNYLLKKGKEYDNQILISSGKESSADVYSSIVVLLASILIQFGDKVSFLMYADKIAGIIVGIFIVRTGYKVIKENFNILIGSQDTGDFYIDVQNTILKNNHIKRIDDLVIMKYGYYYEITIEVSMDASLTLKKAHQEVEKIEDDLKKNDRIKYINIHMNPFE